MVRHHPDRQRSPGRLPRNDPGRVQVLSTCSRSQPGGGRARSHVPAPIHDHVPPGHGPPPFRQRISRRLPGLLQQRLQGHQRFRTGVLAGLRAVLTRC
ncbi:pVIII-s97aa [Fowl aviadenovirus 4]|nr:pVIII-s97aa [Fowl aviadenovirus 4]